MRRYDIGDLFMGQSVPSMQAAPAAPASGGAATGAAPAQAGMQGTTEPTQKKTPPKGGCFGGSPMMTLLPLVLMFVVFYFFLIRPQQKKQKEVQNMLSALRKGDAIVTTGGILGKITGLTDQYAVIEVQEKVRMKIMRSHIAGKQPGTGSSDAK